MFSFVKSQINFIVQGGWRGGLWPEKMGIKTSHFKLKLKMNSENQSKKNLKSFKITLRYKWVEQNTNSYIPERGEGGLPKK